MGSRVVETARAKRKVRAEMDEKWDCSVCTYLNSREAFRCEICHTRKGTSTRKPRLDNKVVEQQQLIAQVILKEKEDELLKRKREYKQERTGAFASLPPRLKNVDRSSPLLFEIFANGYSVVITEFRPKPLKKSAPSITDSPVPSNCSSSIQGLTSTPVGTTSDQLSPVDVCASRNPDDEDYDESSTQGIKDASLRVESKPFCLSEGSYLGIDDFRKNDSSCFELHSTRVLHADDTKSIPFSIISSSLEVKPQSKQIIDVYSLDYKLQCISDDLTSATSTQDIENRIEDPRSPPFARGKNPRHKRRWGRQDSLNELRSDSSVSDKAPAKKRPRQSNSIITLGTNAYQASKDKSEFTELRGEHIEDQSIVNLHKNDCTKSSSIDCSVSPPASISSAFSQASSRSSKIDQTNNVAGLISIVSQSENEEIENTMSDGAGDYHHFKVRRESRRKRASSEESSSGLSAATTCETMARKPRQCFYRNRSGAMRDSKNFESNNKRLNIRKSRRISPETHRCHSKLNSSHSLKDLADIEDSFDPESSKVKRLPSHSECKIHLPAQPSKGVRRLPKQDSGINHAGDNIRAEEPGPAAKPTREKRKKLSVSSTSLSSKSTDRITTSNISFDNKRTDCSFTWMTSLDIEKAGFDSPCDRTTLSPARFGLISTPFSSEANRDPGSKQEKVNTTDEIELDHPDINSNAGTPVRVPSSSAGLVDSCLTCDHADDEELELPEISGVRSAGIHHTSRLSSSPLSCLSASVASSLHQSQSASRLSGDSKNTSAMTDSSGAAALEILSMTGQSLTVATSR